MALIWGLLLALSAMTKSLQHECIQKNIDGAMLTTNNDIVQQFVGVLEAGFLHGLKKTYFEKSKSRVELPKPQFWNLVSEISHKSTLDQVYHLLYIRTHVGRCRAWLRLVLNDNDIVSYLTSLFHSSEQFPLLPSYYESHALFLDQEQRDIFMSYLQGIENLKFDIACNSSLLNSWTRTPLELSGIISATSSRLPLKTEMSNRPQQDEKFQPFNNITNGHDSTSADNRPSRLRLTPSVSPAHSPQLSPATSRISICPSVEADYMVEVNIEKNDSDIDNYILHKRLQRTSKLKSGSVNNLHVDKSRSNSPQPFHDRVNACLKENSSSLFPDREADAPHLQFSNHSNDVVSCDNEKESESLSSQHEQTLFTKEKTAALPEIVFSSVDNENCPADLGAEEDDVQFEPRMDSVDAGAPNLHVDTETSSQTVRSLNASFSSDNEESLDVYAVPSQPLDQSPSSNEEFQSASFSSSGRGNILFCGAGWSSELDVVPDSKPVEDDSPFIDDCRDSYRSEAAELKIREGFLQKKRETLSFWRLRWFVLTTRRLIYYKDENCKNRRGTIDLIDIKNVDDKNVAKKKTACLTLHNGNEHWLTADSVRLISGWIDDVRLAVENVQRSSFVDIDPTESTYVMIDPVGPDSDLNNDNTSWDASMRQHINTIATEKGLDTQKYQCFDCAAPIGMLYGNPRVCYFTGHYYCPQCHLNEDHQIPARMLHNWDFRKYKISKRSKEFLTEIWNEPCIDVSRMNPVAYCHLEDLSKLLPLRTKLAALHPYVHTCRFSLPADLLSILKRRYYMIENPHSYTPNDLFVTRGSTLVDLLKKALSLGTRHVTACDLCMCKGFLCEVCGKGEIIFAFQTDTTNQCEDCKTVYHKICVPDISKCRKCERRNRRLQLEYEKIDDCSE